MSDLPRNIALIGFMGCGKSTVGRLLADRLGWRFLDTDTLIVEAADGRDIPTIFAEEGEAEFRRRESDAVKAASAGWESVIATGGGAILREENAAVLREAALIIWLTARPDVVVSRTQRTAATRPILSAGGPGKDDLLVRVLTLLGERSPRYQAAAHLIVDTSDRTPRAIVDEIVRRAHRNALVTVSSKEVSL